MSKKYKITLGFVKSIPIIINRGVTYGKLEY